MYLNHFKVKKNITRFKKRKTTNTTWKSNFFVFNKIGIFNKKWLIFSTHNMLIELKLYKFFFLKLRRISRRKKFYSFVFLFCNHIFSKKSKNSRMGKGKGKMHRFVCRKKNLQPVFFFKKISQTRIRRFVIFLNKISKRKFFFF